MFLFFAAVFSFYLTLSIMSKYSVTKTTGDGGQAGVIINEVFSSPYFADTGGTELERRPTQQQGGDGGSLARVSKLVEENSSIFFTETDPKLESFPGMKLCAFESAARFNPARKVVSRNRRCASNQGSEFSIPNPGRPKRRGIDSRSTGRVLYVHCQSCK